MHFGEPLDDARYQALITPDAQIPTVLTADAYGAGEADTLLGRALDSAFTQTDPDKKLTREQVCVVGAVGHDFYEGERDGAKGFPRFTDPRLRGPEQYASYLRMAAERSLERCGIDQFDVLLLHNPDRTGYTSEAVWDGDAGAQGRGPHAPDRCRAGSRQRLHTRPDRLLRTLRRSHRLGDGDPQPARAVAGRALPRRRRQPRHQRDHAGRRLRRSVLRRSAAGHAARPLTTTAASARPAGSRPDAHASSGCARSRRLPV